MSSNPSTIRSILCLSWCFIFSFFYLKDWNPLENHPLSLFVRQLAVWDGDIAASFIKITASGSLEILWLLLFALASAGAGALALCVLKNLFSPLQHIVFSVAVGMSLLGYYTLFLGLLGYYCKAGFMVSWVVLGFCSIYGGIFIYRLLRGSSLKSHFSAASLLFGSVLFLAGSFLFAKSLFPVTYIDAVVYHLGVPNYYLQEGGISYIPYDAFSNFPFVAEMIYTLAMLVSGVKSAQVICVFVFFLLLAAVYSFSKRFLTGIPPWMPVLFCLAVPSFMEAAILVKNDLHFVLFFLLAAHCFFEWEDTENCRWLILSGLFMGLCASVKYTALIFLPVTAFVGLCYVVLKKGEGFTRPFLTGLLKLSVPAIVVFSPWLIKNYIWTGNPFYPAFYGFFGGQDMSGEMAIVISKLSHPPGDIGRIIRGFWEHPLMLSMGWHETFERRGFEWNIAPLVFLFAPLLMFIKNAPPVIKKLVAAAAILFLLWNGTFHISRFLYPAIVLGLLAASYAAAMAVKQSFRPVKVFLWALIVFYLFMMIGIGFQTVNIRTMQYGMDGINDTDAVYLGRHRIDNPGALFDGLPANQYINHHTLPSAKILIIGDVQHLYIQRRHRYTYLSATTPYQIFKDKAGEHDKISRLLKEVGYTHIYYNSFEMKRLQGVGVVGYPKEDNRYIEDFLQSKYATPVFRYRRSHIEGVVYELL